MDINYRLKSSQAGCVSSDQLGCQIKDHLRLRVGMINNCMVKIFYDDRKN